jgi:hypothetical protein
MTGILAHRGLLLNSSVAPPPTTWNAAVAATSPWGWWKLDEVAGAAVNAPDSSGNGRNGTYTASGGQTTGIFAGSTTSQTTLGGRVTLPSYTTPTTPAFSVCAFILTSHAVNAEKQICSADNTSGGRIFQFRKRQATGNNQVEALIINPSVVTLTGSAIINDGNPHFVAFVFDQSLAAASGRMKLYVDGVLDAQSNTSVTITAGLSCPIGIGARYGGTNTGLWTDGIDETIFHDRALSSTEIANLWAARNT